MATTDPTQAQPAPSIPMIHQPHTTGMTATPAPAQFAGWGHSERDPRNITYSGTDGMGAPAPLQVIHSDPRDNGGKGGERVSYNNQAPAPQTF